MMKYIFSVLLVLFLFSCKSDNKRAKTLLKEGDLIFQDLDCGPLCDAIEEVTQGRNGLKFSHIGLVVKSNDSLFTIEAIGNEVQLTPLDNFLSRTTNTMYVGRLKKEYEGLIKPTVRFSLKQQGVPYDDPYIYNNGKYYCSELIYDAFMYANNNSPFFSLEPMTFKKPGSKEFFPAWIEYYKQLSINIPQDSLGINPAGISRNEKIDFFELNLVNN